MLRELIDEIWNTSDTGENDGRTMIKDNDVSDACPSTPHPLLRFDGTVDGALQIVCRPLVRLQASLGAPIPGTNRG